MLHRTIGTGRMTLPSAGRRPFRRRELPVQHLLDDPMGTRGGIGTNPSGLQFSPLPKFALRRPADRQCRAKCGYPTANPRDALQLRPYLGICPIPAATEKRLKVLSRHPKLVPPPLAAERGSRRPPRQWEICPRPNDRARDRIRNSCPHPVRQRPLWSAPLNRGQIPDQARLRRVPGLPAQALLWCFRPGNHRRLRCEQSLPNLLHPGSLSRLSFSGRLPCPRNPRVRRSPRNGLQNPANQDPSARRPPP